MGLGDATRQGVSNRGSRLDCAFITVRAFSVGGDNV